jgi:ATP-dependent Lon protease
MSKKEEPYIRKIIDVYDFYCSTDISETPDNPKRIKKNFDKQQLRKLNKEFLRMNKIIEDDTPSLTKILLSEVPDEEKKELLEKFILFIQTEKSTEEFFDYRNDINKSIKKSEERARKRNFILSDDRKHHKKQKILSELDEMKEQIENLNTSEQNKERIMKKFETLQDMKKNDSEYHKLKEYIKKIISVPFGVYSNSEINKECIEKSKRLLEKHVMFNYDAKDEILNCLVNNSNQCIALFGPPGTAKSTLVQKGISEALSRPMKVISLGGKKDASYLTGHSYTYEGSLCGRIIDILIESKVMNPVIYFDELDKISGNDINGVLTHLIDPSQNFDFHDNYFSGISFDLSKVLFVFSYNDKSCLDLVVSDRIKHIEVKVLTINEKIKVMEKITIPDVLEKYLHKENIKLTFDKNLLFKIAEKYHDKGMRDVIREIEHIVSRIKVNFVLKNGEVTEDEQKYLKYRALKMDFSKEIIVDVEMYNKYFQFNINKEIVHHHSMYI